MSTVEETRRELFEAAYLKKYFYPAERWSLVPEKYRTQHAEIAWWAFNAALDAVAIELPKLSKPAVDDDKAWHSIRNQTIKSCARAIESTNLGITVK